MVRGTDNMVLFVLRRARAEPAISTDLEITEPMLRSSLPPLKELGRNRSSGRRDLDGTFGVGRSVKG